MEENITLDEMRSQIALLKEKLDKESIVNDRLLRDALKHKMNNFKWGSVFEYCSCIFVIIFGNITIFQLVHSWPFVIATTILMIICILATYYTHSKANTKDCNGNLLTVAKKMRQIKREYHLWLYFAIPAITIWIIWFSYLLVTETTFGIHLVMAMFFGAIIGSIIGLFLRKKILDTCDDIISQIEE
ncbi:MAG: hypothetical protein KBT06_08250 [Prevotellaceae bacterium]|nr:hypothetical protein [Candidatus Colivivens equi]